MTKLTTFIRPLAFSLTLAISATTMAADEPTPGLYKVIVTIENSALPGPQTRESTQCLEPGEFANGADAFIQQQGSQDCKMASYSVAAGNISMNMDCVVPGGGKAVIIGTGSYSANGFNMTNQMNMNVSGIEIKMTTTATGNRVGDC